MAGDVERLEPWQLPGYLKLLEQRGVSEVGWNKERLPLQEALKRAAGLAEFATVVADDTQLYIAIPDHSADEGPRGPVPLQIWPRKTA
ncbi:MAG TPA: hypothetical protein VFN74_11525 [Chloroflexota bacterium]|jgi:hypothetical protein|nr:hypothetical protein [Chloroflexota bacterium]